jgi:hypothetical protein
MFSKVRDYDNGENNGSGCGGGCDGFGGGDMCGGKGLKGLPEVRSRGQNQSYHGISTVLSRYQYSVIMV